MALVDFQPTSTQLAVPKEPKRMLEVKHVGQQTQVFINASSLSVLQGCPRKAEYLLHRGLVSSTESSATLFGSGIHAALEAYYLGELEERIIPPNFKENMELLAYGQLPDEMNEFLVYRATKAFTDRVAGLSALPPSDKRSIANGVWILYHYFKSWIEGEDPYKVHVVNGEPFVERMLEAVILDTPELKIVSHGTIDVVFEHLHTRQLAVCDHKTTSRLGQDFFNRLKPNHQYTGYLYLFNKNFGTQLDKFIVNGVEVKPKPKTARGTPPNFTRQVTTRSEEDFADYEKTVIYYTKQFLSWCESKEFPLGSVDTCAMWGGCQFLNVCSSPSVIRDNILSANYITAKESV